MWSPSPGCARSAPSRPIRSRDWGGLRVPAALLGLLLLWGGLSALWAIEPARSLVKDMQLAGLFAAAIVLATAARSIAQCTAAGGSGDRRNRARPRRGLERFRHERRAERSGQPAALRAAAPQPDCPSGSRSGAAAAGRHTFGAAAADCSGIAAAFAIGATVFLLDGTAAKTALLLSLPVAALLCWRRRVVARVAAALSVVAVLTSPLTLPLLADDPLVLQRCGHGKDLARPPLLYLGFRRQAHRRAPAARLGSRFGARDTGRQGAEPAGARSGCRCTRTTRRSRSGSNSAYPRRCSSRYCSAGCGCASGPTAGPPLYAAAAGRQPRRHLRRAVGRVGNLAGMVAGDARSSGAHNRRNGARRRRTCRWPAGYSAAAARVARLRSLMSKRCLRIE